jgi:calcium channel MID1
MMFNCPYPGRGLEINYGRRNYSSGDVVCNYMGAVYSLSSAPDLGVSWLRIAGFVILALIGMGVL